MNLSMLINSNFMKKIFIGNASHIPKMVCSGHENPESQINIRLNVETPMDFTLKTIGGMDVTRNNLMVELRPQIIGIMFRSELVSLLESFPKSLFLSLHDPGHIKEPDYCIGKIGLQYHDQVRLGEYSFVLFKTSYCKNYCLSPLRLLGHYLHERIFLFFDNDAHNEHKMKAHYLFNNWLLYCLPRAVALTSFDDGKYTNMFPLDLIGQTDSPYFILSITSRYPSLPYILKNKRLAVSYISLDDTDNAYAMGKNNKRICVKPDEMIVKTKLSPVFSIPVPTSALSVRELDIVDSYLVDYHTVIIAKTRNFTLNSKGLYFCHVQRIFQQYLMNQNRALPYVIRRYKRSVN